MKITHYSFGKMIVNGREYTADLIILPDRVFSSWWRKEGHSLCIEDITEVLKSNINTLVVGTGAYGRMNVPENLKEELKRRGIEVFVNDSYKAVNIFESSEKVLGF